MRCIIQCATCRLRSFLVFLLRHSEAITLQLQPSRPGLHSFSRVFVSRVHDPSFTLAVSDIQDSRCLCHSSLETCVSCAKFSSYLGSDLVPLVVFAGRSRGSFVYSSLLHAGGHLWSSSCCPASSARTWACLRFLGDALHASARDEENLIH